MCYRAFPRMKGVCQMNRNTTAEYWSGAPCDPSQNKHQSQCNWVCRGRVILQLLIVSVQNTTALLVICQERPVCISVSHTLFSKLIIRTNIGLLSKWVYYSHGVKMVCVNSPTAKTTPSHHF